MQRYFDSHLHYQRGFRCLMWCLRRCKYLVTMREDDRVSVQEQGLTHSDQQLIDEIADLVSECHRRQEFLLDHL